MSSKFHYGIEFQMAILRLMTEDAVFFARCKEHLKPEHFAGELGWIFKKMAEYDDRLPIKPDLVADLSLLNESKRTQFAATLDKIWATPTNPDKIKREMTNFIRANIFISSSREAANKYNQGKEDEAYKLTEKCVDSINKLNFGGDIAVGFGTALADIDRVAFDKANAIRTGIIDIDAALGGGFTPGSWTTFLGGSNAGKSMLMATLAFNAAKQGKKTFITIHEDEEGPTKVRFLSCFSGIPINRLTTGSANLTKLEQAQLSEADQLLKEHVKLKFMYTTESTIENVMSTARLLMLEWPFDLFLCDYGQCLTTEDLKRAETRLVHEHVYHMLKQLCLELKIAGAGGAQVNRVGMEKGRKGSELLRCGDVSEAFGIIKKSSNIITINRSNSDVKNDLAIYLIDKSKNGKTEIAVECRSDYSSARTYLTTDEVGPKGASPQQNVSHMIENSSTGKKTIDES